MFDTAECLTIRGGEGEPFVLHWDNGDLRWGNASEPSDLLEELWERKVKPYLDSVILPRISKEELMDILASGGKAGVLP